MRRPFVITCLLAALALAALPARAVTTAGIAGPSFGSAVSSRGGEATGQKPESKLFYTADGTWWGVLGFAKDVTSGVWITELTEAGWVPRLLLQGSDPWSKADALYDATSGELLVSLRDNKPPTETNQRISTLHRLTYDGLGTWAEPGSPITITTANVETITIAEDSAGRVWAAFEQGNRIKAGFLVSGATAFTYLRVSDTGVTPDDIAAVVAFGGPGAGRIGVVWSDQASQRFLFASRADTATLNRASFSIEVAYGGGVGGCPTAASTACADDHVNVKAIGSDLVVAVKTSLNDAAVPDPADPVIVLLERIAGTWSSATVAPVSSNFTRPIVVADPTGDLVHVFANVLGDDTSVWHSSLSAPSFGAPQPWTVDDAYTLSNPTSTKQAVSEATGLVAMTSAPKSPHRYWYDIA